MKYIIICSGKIVTGGTELCHQLCHNMNLRGHDSYIHYFDSNKTIPNKFKIYNVKLCDFVDQHDATFIIPEANMHFYNKIKLGKKIIWWLSVDNYFYKTSKKSFINIIKYILAKVIGKRPLSILSMKNDIHLVQSYYAFHFLKVHNIKSYFLSDYISEVYNQKINNNHRENNILYNPKKGYESIHNFIISNKQLNFLPLENLSSNEIINYMTKSKIYIDFGNHPGKDRLPREAALSGCVIITGQRGSANNLFDINIPSIYKLNQYSDDFEFRLITLISKIFDDYQIHFNNQSEYREKIMSEKSDFISQLDFFKKYESNTVY